MIKNRTILKGIAVFLIVEVFATAIFPPGLWALTAGPTSPETSSFEPIDTTDMVNLATGDLAYNIPLLEVPGPGGGYPLSLSYHAGISPNVDASWVGLGFSLNPGAINRQVSGLVDDFNGKVGSSWQFWEGGETSTYSVGVTVGQAGVGGVSAGLVFSNDTYKGFGVGHYAGLRAGLQYGPASAGFGINHSVDPYGGSYSSSGMNVGIGVSTGRSLGMISAGASAGWGITESSVNGGASSISSGMTSGYSISYNGNVKTSVDGNLSSGKTSLGIGGASIERGVQNNLAGNISTYDKNRAVSIPTPWGFTVDLGMSYRRYWIDATSNVPTYGSLYFPATSLPTSSQLDERAYDVYDLMDDRGPISKRIPSESLVGSFVDYDSYQVLAQGVSGSIRPYHYKSYLLRQNQKQGDDYLVMGYPLGTNKQAAFRFADDFSNRFLHDASLDAFQTNSPSNPISLQFDANQTTGESGTDGFEVSTNNLPGSKNIVWYTNTSILDNDRQDGQGNPIPSAAKNGGFIACRANGFVRPDDDQIGGFKITNESGVTYHFSLPVYSREEYSYSGKVDEENKHMFNVHNKSSPYAYTWLLTAVTGSDFVDANSNGYADADDLGYWVIFEYGLWSDSYSWRNPGIGFNKDIDQEFNNYSKGKKQVYYLDAIKTKTHTAVFVKKLRWDGKGVVHEFQEAVKIGHEHDVKDIDHGGFNKKAKTFPALPTPINFVEYPTSTLGLQSVYLFQNSDFSNGDPTQELAGKGNVYFHPPIADVFGSVGKNTRSKYVIDVHDIEALAEPLAFRSKCLRKIELVTDYSLCPGTDNSYISELDALNTSEQGEGGTMGKLTLKALKFYGKAEASVLPDTKFSYGEDETMFGSMTRTFVQDENLYTLKISGFDYFNFKPGEIIHKGGIRDSYGYITDVNIAAKEIRVRFFDGEQYVGNLAQTEFHRTKNPPYRSDAYDLWGLHKVDYVDDELMSENERRRVTVTSAQSLDTWCLRTVTSSLGAKIHIEYEPDRYRSVLKSLSNVAVKNLEVVSGNTVITLFEDVANFGLEVGDKIKFRFLNAVRYDVTTGQRFQCDEDEKDFMYQWIYDDNGLSDTYERPVLSITSNSITIGYNYLDRIPSSSATCMLIDGDYSNQEGLPANECIPMNSLSISPPEFLGGEIMIDNSQFATLGGGLRVKKISVDQFDKTSSTLYKYDNGITPYEPLGFAVPVRKLSKDILYPCLEHLQNAGVTAYRDDYIQDVFKRYQFLFANSRELPGPGVLYELVTVSEQIDRNGEITNLDGKTEYQFEVFSPQTIDVDNVNHPLLVAQYNGQVSQDLTPIPHAPNYSGTVAGLHVSRIETRNSTILKDFTSIMGSLKRMTLIDNEGNKLSETVNHYLHDDFAHYQENLETKYLNQGTVSETFADARLIYLNTSNNVRNYALGGVISQKIRYPSIQVGQTVKNYKTGISTTTNNLAFDFYSGETIKVASSDAYGNHYLTEITPAYRKYAELGIGGKNMLTQQAGSEVYRYSLSDPGLEIVKQQLVQAEAQTWSNDLPVLGLGTSTGVWRKSASYSFVGLEAVPLTSNGLYPYASYSPFSAWNDQQLTSAGWQRNAGVTLYDKFSHALEGVDVNGQFAATKMSLDQTQVYSTAANTRYDQYAYSGAEDYDANSTTFGGGVLVGEGTVLSRIGESDMTTVHTGLRALSLDNGETGFRYTITSLGSSKYYHASVWTNSTAGKIRYKVNGVVSPQQGVASETRKAGSWYLIELLIPTEGVSNLEVWCEATGGTANHDDFRVEPYDAAVVSYVYNQWGELSYVLDAGNMYTKFEYDGTGKLVGKHRETFNYGPVKTSGATYHYANKTNN